MKRPVILLLILAALVLVPLGHTGASSPFIVNHPASAGLPLAGNVISVSAAISSLGLAGHYFFNRHKKE